MKLTAPILAVSLAVNLAFAGYVLFRRPASNSSLHPASGGRVAPAATDPAQRSRWIGIMKGGNAFSTNPKDAPREMTDFTATIVQVPPPTPAASRSSSPGGG